MSQQLLISPSAPRTAATSARTRFSAVLVATAAFALGALTFGPSSPALAHDQLVGTEVVEKADGSAEAVRLSFNNSVIEVGTEFMITGPDGADARGGEPVVAGPDVTQPIAAGLEAGNYVGAWRVVSSDGHPIDGEFTLSVAEDGSAELHEGGSATEVEEETAVEAEQGTATPEDEGGLPTGAIIGLAGGVIVIVALVVMLTKRRQPGAAPGAHTSTDSHDSSGGSQ